MRRYAAGGTGVADICAPLQIGSDAFPHPVGNAGGFMPQVHVAHVLPLAGRNVGRAGVILALQLVNESSRFIVDAQAQPFQLLAGSGAVREPAVVGAGFCRGVQRGIPADAESRIQGELSPDFKIVVFLIAAQVVDTSGHGVIGHVQKIACFLESVCLHLLLAGAQQ